MPRHNCNCYQDDSDCTSLPVCQGSRNARHQSNNQKRLDRRRRELAEQEEVRRMRELQERAREVELEEIQEQQRKEEKRTCKYKFCRIIKILTGIISVCGLFLMFYVLGVIIIDDVSPLEVFTFSSSVPKVVEEDLFNVSNTIPQEDQEVTEIPTTYLPDLSYNDSKQEGRSYVAYIPVPLNNEDKGIEENDNTKLSKRKSETIKKPVLVPVMVVPNDRAQTIDYPQRRPNLRRTRYGYNENKYRNNYDAPLNPIRRQIRVKDQYRSRTSPTRRRIPLGTRSGFFNNRPATRRIGGSQNSDYRSYEGTSLENMRRVIDEQPYKRRSSSRKRRYRYKEPIEEESSFLTSIYNVITNPSSLFSSGDERPPTRPPRYRSRDRRYNGRRQPLQKASSRGRSKTRNSRPSRRAIYNRRRPPLEYRYPPSAGSIQDILEYMDSRETKSHKLRNLQSNLPKRFIIGDQEHVIGHNIYKANHGYTIEDQDHVIGQNYYGTDLSDIKIETEDDVAYGNVVKTSEKDEHEYDYDTESLDFVPQSNPSSPYDNHDTLVPTNLNGYYRPQIPIKNQLPIQTVDTYRRPVAPVRNTYDVTKERTHQPFTIMMDVYPKEDIKEQHRRPFETIFTLGNQPTIYRDRHQNSAFQYNQHGSKIDRISDDNKHEIVLHINLFARKPSKSRSNFNSGNTGSTSVSLNLPVAGKMSPLDIYRAVISQARQYPRASAHTKISGESSKTVDDETVDIELFDVEDGPQLYLAIKQGLTELNPLLPQNLQFNIPPEDISTEELYNIGSSNDSESISKVDENDLLDEDNLSDQTVLVPITTSTLIPEMLPTPS